MRAEIAQPMYVCMYFGPAPLQYMATSKWTDLTISRTDLNIIDIQRINYAYFHFLIKDSVPRR